MLTLKTDTAKRSTVTNSAAQLGAMAARFVYLFATTTACYIKQGANPTATAGDGSMLVPAGGTALLHGVAGAKISVLRVSADGECTLTQGVQS